LWRPPTQLVLRCHGNNGIPKTLPCTGGTKQQHYSELRLHLRISFISPRESRYICFCPTGRLFPCPRDAAESSGSPSAPSLCSCLPAPCADQSLLALTLSLFITYSYTKYTTITVSTHKKKNKNKTYLVNACKKRKRHKICTCSYIRVIQVVQYQLIIRHTSSVYSIASTSVISRISSPVNCQYAS